VTSCAAEINIVDFNISGNSSLTTLIHSMPKAMLLPMMGGFINQPLCRGVQELIETNGTAALRQGAALVEGLLLPPKALPSPEPVGQVVDWGTYPPIVVMQALLHERFSVWANRVVSIVDSSVFHRRLVATDNVSLVLSHLGVNGLIPQGHDSVLQLTTPDSSRSTLGLNANLHHFVLQGMLSLEVSLPGEPVLRESFKVTMGLENLSLAVRAVANKPTLDSLTLDAARIMHSPSCLLQCTEGTTTLQNESIALESMDVTLKPIFNVSSVRGDLEMESTDLINTVVGSLYTGYFPTLGALAHGALGLARVPLNEMLWDRLQELPPCSSSLLLGLSVASGRSIFGAAIAVFAVGLLLAISAWWRVDRTKGGALSEVRAAEAAAAAATVVNQTSSQAEVCLARQEFVPRALALSYPFALVGVMCLFLYADLTLGATVSVVFAAKGELTTIGPVFSFSLLSTVVHSWQSGAYIISVIAALTSGFWPFLKLNLLLATWLMPPRLLSTRTRGCILGFLNTWGKYSFVDCWFLVLSMSAFAIEWQSIGAASMKVVTTPTAGFYVFFTSTGLSLILGHIASEYHAHAEKVRHRVSEPVELAAAQLDDPAPPASVSDESSRPAPLSAAAAQPAANALRRPQAPVALSAVAVPRWLRVAVASALGASVVLMLAGTFLVSFDFEVGGIFIEFLFGREVSRQYSLLSIGMAVTDGRMDNVGLLGLEAVFLILAVVMPLVLLTALLILWLMPMSLPRQEELLRVCYILDTWSSLDVAVLVLIIADLQFGTLAEFLVYRGNLATPCYMIRDLTQSECVQMDLVSRPTIAVLLIAGFALLVLPKVAMRLCARAIFREAGSPEFHEKAVDKMEPHAKDEVEEAIA